MSDISRGADTLACARPAVRVKAGHLAALLRGVALTRADQGALEPDATRVRVAGI